MRSGLFFVVWTIALVTAGKFSHRHRLEAKRIINGTEMAHSQVPFLVSIEYLDENTDEWSATCGASIVNTVTVLTACHCATRDEQIHGYTKYLADPDKRRVVAGTGFWNRDTPSRQIAKIKRIVTHPRCQNFNVLDRNFVNDVALFFLNDPLVYGPEVQPLKLPSYSLWRSVHLLKHLVSRGESCTAVGWGRTIEFNWDQSEKLMAADVQLLPPDVCRKRFCNMAFTHCSTNFERFGQFCVASPEASNCFGDSGSPLICRGYVVGTVSYGTRCLPNLPTVYQGLRPIMEVLAINNVRVDYYSQESFGGEPIGQKSSAVHAVPHHGEELRAVYAVPHHDEELRAVHAVPHHDEELRAVHAVPHHDEELHDEEKRSRVYQPVLSEFREIRDLLIALLNRRRHH